MALSRRSGNRFQASIWPGFVDAMTGLLLVLMFVLTIFMVVQYVLRETITGQEEELHSLSAEIAALAEALGLERDRSASLTAEVGTLSATIDDANAQAEAQAALIAALRADSAAQAQALNEANARITSFEDQVAALLSEREGNLASIADLNAARAELMSREEALSLALAQARTEIDAQAEAARLAAARREAMEALIADLRRKNAEGEELAASRADENTALNARLADMLALLTQEQEAREALARELTDEQAARAALAERLRGIETSLTEEEERRLAEAAAAEALRERLKQANAELTAMTLALEEQRRKAEETLAMLAASRAAEEDLTVRLAAALLATQQAEDRIGSLTRSQGEAGAELDRLRSELDAARRAAEGQASELTSIQAALAAALIRITEEEARAAEAETLRDRNGEALAARDSELAAIRERLGDTQEQAEAFAARMQAENADLARQLAEAMARVREQEARIGSLSDDLSARGSRIDNLEAELAGLEAELRDIRENSQALQAQLEGTERTLQDRLAAALARNSRDEARIAALEEKLAEAQIALGQTEEDLRAARDAAGTDRRSLEAQLAAALAAKLRFQQTEEETRNLLAAALAARLAAENEARTRLSEAEQRAALLSTAQTQLDREKALSAEAQKQAELLNQQVAALRKQLSSLQGLLDDAQSRDEAAKVQLQNLGSQLNTALARAVAEERKRRELEEAERKRLEAETRDLARYRSEFFGRLRDVLAAQEGVRIVGDRFVFSSEVLFPPGGAELSSAGRAQIDRIAGTLGRIANDIPEGIDWILRVDGHTDNVPLSGFGEFRDNWELSQARALAVVRYMADELGIPPNRLSANGFGEFQPIAPGDSEGARAQNRRIELKFTER